MSIKTIDTGCKVFNKNDNSRPLNLQLWSDRPEVDAAVDAIFAECITVSEIKRRHPRMKSCLKVVLLNLFNVLTEKN